MNIELAILNNTLLLSISKLIINNQPLLTLRKMYSSTSEFLENIDTQCNILIIECELYELLPKRLLNHYKQIIIITTNIFVFNNKLSNISYIKKNSDLEKNIKNLLSSFYTETKSITYIIEKELHFLKIDSSLKGYKYINHALECSYNESIILENLEYDVYENLAFKYNENKEKIKWNINTCINSIYTNNSENFICNYFNFEKNRKITPKIFFTTILSKI